MLFYLCSFLPIVAQAWCLPCAYCTGKGISFGARACGRHVSHSWHVVILLCCMADMEWPRLLAITARLVVCAW
jgi:hypothetical protein